jgi:hypothetical protein
MLAHLVHNRALGRIHSLPDRFDSRVPRLGAARIGEAAVQVPGEYFDDCRHYAVTVVNLTCAECLVCGACEHAAPGTPVRCFIGAVGPIAGRAGGISGDRLCIRFSQPIDDLIVSHFAAF